MKSFDALYREYGDKLVRYTRRVGRGSHYAEDAAQEAWIAFLKSDGVENPKGWLTIAAKRAYWDHMKREVRKTSVGDYDMIDAPCEGDQEAMMERSRIAEAVRGLKVPVNGLSKAKKPASQAMKDNLELMFCGYDSGEIARARGVSRQGVHDNLERGIKALKAEWGIDD